MIYFRRELRRYTLYENLLLGSMLVLELLLFLETSGVIPILPFVTLNSGYKFHGEIFLPAMTFVPSLILTNQIAVLLGLGIVYFQNGLKRKELLYWCEDHAELATAIQNLRGIES